MRKPKAFDSWPPAKQEEWRVKDRASQKAYRQTPKYKAYKQTPEYKAYQKARQQRIREDEAANLFFAMMKATEEISAINTQPNQTNDNDTNEPTSKD